ncbi:MAG: hypothetical protein PVI28_14275 [Gammaproteobacteria bacterium]|jgi:hypothetical protein
MIFYLAKEQHAYTINDYLKAWAPTLTSLLKPIAYGKLNSLAELGPGSYIFTDIDRLSSAENERLTQECRFLSGLSNGIRLLNHPTRSMRRYELLRTLYERGWNDFNVYRIAEQRRPERFPVFLRSEHDHAGSISPLLHTADALDKALRHSLVQRSIAPRRLGRAVKKLFRPGISVRDELKKAQHRAGRQGLLMTEFRDTSDKDGIYRKYSAFIVGDRILPQHIFFSSDWMVKRAPSKLPDEAQLVEEEEYVLNNFHEPQLRKVFNLARIEYGRIDYSVDIDGRLQVWEINTNPVIFSRTDPSSRRNAMRRSLREHFSKEFQAALKAIDHRETAASSKGGVSRSGVITSHH